MLIENTESYLTFNQSAIRIGATIQTNGSIPVECLNSGTEIQVSDVVAHTWPAFQAVAISFWETGRLCHSDHCSPIGAASPGRTVHKSGLAQAHGAWHRPWRHVPRSGVAAAHLNATSIADLALPLSDSWRFPQYLPRSVTMRSLQRLARKPFVSLRPSLPG